MAAFRHLGRTLVLLRDAAGLVQRDVFVRAQQRWIAARLDPAAR
jgi:hypothetical protein